VVVVSRISAFLRLLEDLLLQTHQLALVDATFVIPDDKEDSDSSDSDRDDFADPSKKTACWLLYLALLWTAKLVFFPCTADARNDEERANLRSALASRVSVPAFIQRGDVYLKGAMTLSSKLRDVLARRAKLSVIYAAIWAFGGAANSSELFAVPSSA
jgi:hypothetical protein